MGLNLYQYISNINISRCTAGVGLRWQNSNNCQHKLMRGLELGMEQDSSTWICTGYVIYNNILSCLLPLFNECLLLLMTSLSGSQKRKRALFPPHMERFSHGLIYGSPPRLVVWRPTSMVRWIRVA